MPRSAGGTYSLPATYNPVIPGTRIQAAAFNATMADLAAALDDSASRSGKGSFTAPVRGPDGSSAAPGHSFSGETNSGIYRAGAGDVRLAVLGADVFKAVAGAVGAAVWGALGATSAILRGAVADGAAAVGVILDNGVTLADAAAKLVSVRNNGVEKAYFDKDGHLVAPATVKAWGTIMLGASPAAVVTAGFNVASAEWSSVASAGSVYLSQALPSTSAVVLMLQLGGTPAPEVPAAQIADTTTINFYRSAGGLAAGQVYGFVVVA